MNTASLSAKQQRVQELREKEQQLQENYKTVVGKRQLDSEALKAVASLDYLWFVFSELNYVMDKEETNNFISEEIREPLGLDTNTDTKEKLSEPSKITPEPKELNDLTLECYCNPPIKKEWLKVENSINLNEGVFYEKIKIYR